MNMLVRGISEETKARLEQRAKLNGRSQNAEALAILEESLKPEKRTWFDILREAAEETGGVELERPTWAPARDFSFDLS